MALTVTIGSSGYHTAGDQNRVSGTLAFDSSYASGGEALTAAHFGLQMIDHLDVLPKSGFMFEHNKTSGTLVVSRGGGNYMLNVDTTAATQATTSAVDTKTYSLPAGTLSANGMGVKVRAWGTTAATANAKTIALKFGSSTVLTTGALLANALDWEMEAVVIRTAAATQEAYGRGQFSGAVIQVNESEPNQDLTAAVSIAINVTSATATGGVSVEGFTVEAFDAQGASSGAVPVTAGTNLSALTGVPFHAYGV